MTLGVGWREKQKTWKASLEAERLKRAKRCRSAWRKRQEPEIGTARNHRRVAGFRFVTAFDPVESDQWKCKHLYHTLRRLCRMEEHYPNLTNTP